MARRPDRQLAELAALGGPVGERQLPGQVEQCARPRRAGGAVGNEPAARRLRSELLAQVRGHGRVVPERLVQVARVGPVVTGGQLDEGRAATRPIRSTVADQLRARRRVRGPRHRRRGPGSARSGRRARTGAWRGTATNPRIAPSCSATMTAPSGGANRSRRVAMSRRAGGIALVGEQRRDGLGVVAVAGRRLMAAVSVMA